MRKYSMLAKEVRNKIVEIFGEHILFNKEFDMSMFSLERLGEQPVAFL